MGGSWINGVEVLGDYLLRNGGPSLAWLVLCFISLKKVGFSLVASCTEEEEEMFRDLGI